MQEIDLDQMNAAGEHFPLLGLVQSRPGPAYLLVGLATSMTVTTFCPDLRSRIVM